MVHASLRQMLARYPAAVPALLQPPAALAEAAAGATVALVFGREESGLLEAELALCSHACSIPTGRQQPSMNLSHSVAVVASQLFDLQQQRLLAAAEQPDEPGAAQRLQQAAQQQEQQEGEDADFWAATLGPVGPSGSLFESGQVRYQRDQVLSGATQAELEALLSRAAALLEAAGIRCVWVGAACKLLLLCCVAACTHGKHSNLPALPVSTPAHAAAPRRAWGAETRGIMGGGDCSWGTCEPCCSGGRPARRKCGRCMACSRSSKGGSEGSSGRRLKCEHKAACVAGADPPPPIPQPNICKRSLGL